MNKKKMIGHQYVAKPILYHPTAPPPHSSCRKPVIAEQTDVSSGLWDGLYQTTVSGMGTQIRLTVNRLKS